MSIRISYIKDNSSSLDRENAVKLDIVDFLESEGFTRSLKVWGVFLYLYKVNDLSLVTRNSLLLISLTPAISLISIYILVFTPLLFSQYFDRTWDLWRWFDVNFHWSYGNHCQYKLHAGSVSALVLILLVGRLLWYREIKEMINKCWSNGHTASPAGTSGRSQGIPLVNLPAPTSDSGCWILNSRGQLENPRFCCVTGDPYRSSHPNWKCLRRHPEEARSKNCEPWMGGLNMKISGLDDRLDECSLEAVRYHGPFLSLLFLLAFLKWYAARNQKKAINGLKPRWRGAGEQFSQPILQEPIWLIIREFHSPICHRMRLLQVLHLSGGWANSAWTWGSVWASFPTPNTIVYCHLSR